MNIDYAKNVNALGRQAEKAYHDLRSEIENGMFPPASRLPTERELVKRFDISRATLRQAIAQLARDGLVMARQGSGTFVTEQRQLKDRLNTISMMYTFDKNILSELQNHVLSLGCLLNVFLQNLTHWNPKSERLFLQQIKDQDHQALLAFCSPLEPHNDDILQSLESNGVRVLHIEHYRLQLPDQNYLLPDLTSAGHMATIALMLAGYEHLFFATYENSNAPYLVLQEQGFEAAMLEHRGGFDRASQVLNYPYGMDLNNLENSMDLMSSFLKSVPKNSGIVVLNIENAEMMAEMAPKCGLRIPEDIGIIGIELIGDNKSPKVDSMVFNREKLLHRAVEEVLKPDWVGIHELVKPKRICHGSVR